MGDGGGNIGFVMVVDVAQHQSQQESGDDIHERWVGMKKSESQR